eukprot:s53_g19.t1
MAALLAGDAAARARAQLALSAGASLEEVEEARQLAENVQGEQAFLSWLVSSLRSCRRYGDALRYSKRQMELWRQEEELGEMAKSLCEIAELCITLDQVEEATEAGRTAESIFKRLKDSQGEARVLLEVVSKVEMLKGEADVAHLAAKQASILYQREGMTSGECKALKVLSEQHVSAGEHEEALQVLGEAAVRFRKCNEQIPLAEMLIAAVAVHLDVGRLSQARKAADTALGVCRHLGPSGQQQLAAGLCASARAHLADRDVRSWTIASQEAKEAQQLSVELQDAQGEVTARLLLSDALMAGGKLQEAYIQLSTLAVERRACADLEGEAIALYQCFRALRDAGSTETAIGTLHQALNIYWSLSDGSGAMKCLYALAQVHLAAGDSAASLQALSEVLGMVKRYRRKQRMEASVLDLVAKAMLAMPPTELQENSGLKAEAPEAKKEGKAAKGKGKGPAGPAPVKGKSKGKEASAAVPSWQKPEISAEWLLGISLP